MRCRRRASGCSRQAQRRPNFCLGAEALARFRQAHIGPNKSCASTTTTAGATASATPPLTLVSRVKRAHALVCVCVMMSCGSTRPKVLRAKCNSDCPSLLCPESIYAAHLYISLQEPSLRCHCYLIQQRSGSGSLNHAQSTGFQLTAPSFPLSRASRLAISSSSRTKSYSFVFSMMRVGVADFGSGTNPHWSDQRKRT